MEESRLLHESTMLDDFRHRIDTSLKSVRSFLSRPLKVTSGNVVLGTSNADARSKSRADDRQRSRQMQQDLHRMLERHPSSRKLMRHLDVVERALRKSGLSGLKALPIEVVEKALAQMEQVVWDWSPTGLAELRSRMSLLVKKRRLESVNASLSTDPTTQPASSVPPRAEPDSTRADLRDMDVSEVDHDTYEEMERSWVGQVPKPRQPPGPGTG
jgi:hypothetical protein